MAKIILDDPIGQRINQWHESQQEPPRPHMGCSLIGTSCERWLWLSFRWAVAEKHNGTLLQLFDVGHREEAVIVQKLINIGFSVEHTVLNSKQKRADFGSHVSGSMDGRINSGLESHPDQPHLLEIKTAGSKTFKKLLKQGLKKTSWQHYVQMQLYMHHENLQAAVYITILKAIRFFYLLTKLKTSIIKTVFIIHTKRSTNISANPSTTSA